MSPRVLVVLTSVDKIDALNEPTGWYLPEFAHPHHVLSSKAEIVVASPKGGVAPLDPRSVEMFKEDAVSTAFLNSSKALWENTKPIKDFLGKAAEFDALLYPGGHGPMFDLATDKDSIQLIQEFNAAGKVLSAVCHGPAAFVNVKVDGGKSLLQGRTATGFSNAEEDAAQMSAAMPFMLETSMADAGANFVKADALFGPKVVVDGKLITGQNPASSMGLGEEILKAISA